MPALAADEGGWARFWYAPGSPTNLAVARILLAGTALWVLLSRPDLPSVLTLPDELWAFVPPHRRVRFLLLFDHSVERALYAVLHVSLSFTLLGIYPRVAGFVSGLLLYHFAPLESVIWTGNPYLRGFTIPLLGLLIISSVTAPPVLSLWPGAVGPRQPAPDYRWPVRLVQILVCQIYFFAGYSKLVTSGLAWPTGENMRRSLLLLDQWVGGGPGVATWLARFPSACAALGWGGLVLELGFPLVLVSTLARRLFVPAAVLFHLANLWILHIFVQSMLLLLIFFDWDAVLARRAGRARAAG